MKYVVSVENTSYFYWQLELLIESFLIHGIQDDLIICFAENDGNKVGGYSKNIIKYGKKIMHENTGKEKGCPVANRIYALRNLYRSGDLDLPFVVIHSDMILKNPIEKYNSDSFDIVINNYGISKNSVVDSYIEDLGLKKELMDKGYKEEEIENFPFSMPIIFNESLNREFANNFFDKLIINLNEIIKNKLLQIFLLRRLVGLKLF
jgi:hypothetical protein